jgi:quercetin dioxygenase-like cupin family protein
VKGKSSEIQIFGHRDARHHCDRECRARFRSRAIPNIPGKSLVALVVDYPPGGTSIAHTHAKSAFIYAHVISGEIESKVNDGETRIYKAGESWSEPPAASHPVSRNVSKTKPARLLAVFVVDSAETQLTTPVE